MKVLYKVFYFLNPEKLSISHGEHQVILSMKPVKLAPLI